MHVAACCLLIAAALLAAGDKGTARAAGRGAPPAPVAQERTGRVLVRLKPGGVAADALAPARVGNAAVVDEVGELGIFVLRPSAGDVYALLELLERNPDVEFAEAELVRRASAEPNDPALRLQWGHRAIRSAQGWDIGRGSAKVKIAVVDTGVDYDHLDLAARHAGERNFVEPGENPYDDHGHGTHVAGIAAATADNALGTAGVGWHTSVLAVKVLDAEGAGSDASVSKGVVWAARNGAFVINLSLGAPGYSRTLAEAVAYAQRRGSLVVAAAGNEALTTNARSYPAALPGVVGVGATTRSDERASFSSHGDWVDISAPGAEILSTTPLNAYEYMSGTSMATPFVAGAAAVVKARYPGMSAAQVWDRLRTGANDVHTRGYDRHTGHGRLNLLRALAIPGTARGVVTDAATGRPLSDATVRLRGSGKSVTTDARGRYSMGGVPYGSQVLLFSRRGYHARSRGIWMPANGRVSVDASLSPGG